jgi:hypothetical protein
MTVEFEKFDRTMTDLLKVTHSEIKAKLDAEKAAKARKRESRKSDVEGKRRDDRNA